MHLKYINRESLLVFKQSRVLIPSHSGFLEAYTDSMAEVDMAAAAG